MGINDIEWIYEETGSQGYSKGDRNYLGYDKTIRTLIRESIQNSLDAKTKETEQNEEAVEIKIKIKCFNGNEKKKLLKALKWDLVKEHVDWAAEDDANYNNFVKSINNSDYFCVFVIEDNNCIGLRGSEFGTWEERMKNYRGFVKSENISIKEGGGSGAGGTYGVGKFIFWKYARTSIVFANSTVDRISDDWNGDSDSLINPRLVGISRLPGHKFPNVVNDIEGKGFFGRTSWNANEHLSNQQKEDYLQRPDMAKKVYTTTSIWDAEADALSKKIGLYRDGSKTGTSIGVYGYLGDVIKAAKLSPRELAKNEIPTLIDEVKYNWWRQIHDGELNVTVELLDNNNPIFKKYLDKDEIHRNDSMLGPLVQMYENYRDKNFLKAKSNEGLSKDKLFVIEIPAEIKTDLGLTNKQAKAKGIIKHDKQKVKADLLIYMPSNIKHEIPDYNRFEKYQRARPNRLSFATLNRTALLRGKGVPVIKYDDSNTHVHFFAIVMGGRARGNSDNDNKLENFLKLCEDEGHSDWWDRSRHKLNNIYDNWRKSRTDFKKRIKDALDNILIDQSEAKGKLNKNFAKYLKFGRKGKSTPKPKFDLVPGDSEYNEGVWKVRGVAKAPENNDKDWSVMIWPYLKSDNKTGEFSIDITKHTIDESVDAIANLESGKLILKAKREIKELPFEITTVNTSTHSGKLGRLSLRLRRLKNE